MRWRKSGGSQIYYTMVIPLVIAFFRNVVVALLGSVLILLLVLKASKPCREFFFARILLPFALWTFGSAFDRIRQEVLDTLNELESHDEKLRKANSLRVLELGIGGGSNFQGIRRKIELTAVDPNASFKSSLLNKLKKYPNIHLERLVTAKAEDMHHVPSSSVDAVLITHVLCSVTDPKKVLAEIKRVLVPGGKLLFMEHVAYPEGTWTLMLQKALDPIWSIIGCGCSFTRTSGRSIRAAGFAEVHMKDVNLRVLRVIARHMYGTATKGKD